ncbi:ATP-binding protein [Jeotgalibacillus proteolyticus]|uniref:ATP-binding protein n=1 Tax=Jeotgalibacillus proteolyticus TaxID=2082395 RepID=UPI003CEB38A8
MLTYQEKTELINEKKSFFEKVLTRVPKLSEAPRSFSLVHLSSIYIQDHPEEDLSKVIFEAIRKWVTGLSVLETNVLFLLHGNKGEIKISFAESIGGMDAAAADGIFPSVTTDKEESFIQTYAHTAALSGIPALDEEQPFSWMTPFLREHAHEAFTVLITAEKTEPDSLLSELEERFRYWSKKKSVTESFSQGESSQKQKGNNKAQTLGLNPFAYNDSQNDSTTTGTTHSSDASNETSSALAEQHCDLIRHHMDRFEKGYSEGLWHTAIYVSAEKKQVLYSVQRSLTGLVAGKETGQSFKLDVNENWRNYMETGMLPPKNSAHSLLNGNCHPAASILNSEELSMLLSLPSEAYPGFDIEAVNDFGTAGPRAAPEEESWKLGTFFRRNKLTSTSFTFPVSLINQHILVAGLTGSGKTNTIFHLLRNTPTPFLIIEPTKQEYRHLVSKDPAIELYTLGDETLSPVRLNPFYFSEGISVMTHIDSLKAVFMSAFSMYASMPNILEQCLYSIYEKTGWNLYDSNNVFMTEGTNRENLFPTLQDLHQEIDQYLHQSGYAEEQKSNIRAALLTRLKSLMTGSKGMLLNTKRSLDFKHLISTNTIIELEHIADEDDKALIMGLFFIRLSEELKLTGKDKIEQPLKHFTVIEEAHRLFKNHEESGNPEVANIKGKAVAFFCDLLSEIRSKGEGIIIVDQVPTKLAPDTLKNTNTKIIHRIVSLDDAEYVSQSLVLNKEKDIQFLSQLNRGEGLIYSSGMKRAAHVLIESSKHQVDFISEEEFVKKALRYNSFIEERDLVHPLAEHIFNQDQQTVDRLSRSMKRFYFSALYGDAAKLNELVLALKTHAIGITLKAGYELPSDQKESFMKALLKKAAVHYCHTVSFYKNSLRTRDMLLHYLSLLVTNSEYLWSEKELAVMDKQRKRSIFPLMKESGARLLFDEKHIEWMTLQPHFANCDAVDLASTLIAQSIFDQLNAQKNAEENARVLYESSKLFTEDQFYLSSDSEYAKELLHRTLKQLTIASNNEGLWLLFKKWTQEDNVYAVN